MPNRAQDWFNQATRDLLQAEESRKSDEHYGALQSKEGVSYAREIIEFVRSQMA